MATKRLIFVPLVHDPWSDFPDTNIVNVIGPNPDKHLVHAVREGLDQYWDEVDQYLEGKSIQKVYQEEYHEKILLQTYLDHHRRNAQKSRNSRVICSLLERNASLMVTESYNVLQSVLNENDMEKIIKPRDIAIARNIERSLEESDTAVLFLGLYHKVDKILRQRNLAIQVEIFVRDIEYLIHTFDALQENYQRSIRYGE